MTDPTETAVAIFEAYRTKDRERIDALLTDDFHFTSPRDNRLDRESYLDHCWPGSREMTKVDVVATARAGERVYVTYEITTARKRFRNTDVLTVRGSQVSEIEVYFGWDIPHAASPGGWVIHDA